jgi:acyl-CoA thioesterase-1
MVISSKIFFLFQGDSITDSGRNYKKNESLGTGYVELLSLWLSAMHPEIEIKVQNKGVSGNKIEDLKNRWQKDTLDLKPDIISILIGTNDIVGSFLGRPTTSSDFENDYRTILQRSYDNLPRCKIVLLEPFLLAVSRSQIRLVEDLNEKLEVICNLSKEFNTTLIPLNEIFNETTRKMRPQFWSQDGFHPTAVGHALIAQSWLKTCAYC